MSWARVWLLGVLGVKMVITLFLVSTMVKKSCFLLLFWIRVFNVHQKETQADSVSTGLSSQLYLVFLFISSVSLFFLPNTCPYPGMYKPVETGLWQMTPTWCSWQECRGVLQWTVTNVICYHYVLLQRSLSACDCCGKISYKYRAAWLPVYDLTISMTSTIHQMQADPNPYLSEGCFWEFQGTGEQHAFPDLKNRILDHLVNDQSF